MLINSQTTNKNVKLFSYNFLYYLLLALLEQLISAHSHLQHNQLNKYTEEATLIFQYC